MSCQKGNASRSRPQRYQNHTSFKNNLYDNSHKIKQINSIKVTDVCERCKKIIEWKIKYKKYKALKAPMKCTKCEQKTVKYSYHNICLPCAKQQEVCPKCGQKKEIVEGKPSKEEQIKLDAEFKVILKTMSERKRRAFLRYMNQQSSMYFACCILNCYVKFIYKHKYMFLCNKKNSYPTSFLARNKENKSKPHTSELDINTDETGINDKNQDETNSKRREDLLMKLKSLAIIEDDDNIDTDNERENDNFDSDVDELLYDKKFSK